MSRNRSPRSGDGNRYTGGTNLKICTPPTTPLLDKEGLGVVEKLLEFATTTPLLDKEGLGVVEKLLEFATTTPLLDKEGLGVVELLL